SPMRLKALLLKADVESDIDAISVRPFNADRRRRDWQEILDISQKLGDRSVEARARGELGLVKVLGGDPIGSDEIGTALWQAKDAGDVRNELRFRTAIARLYLMVGRSHDALGHLERAVELAEREQALSYFPASFEKAIAFLDEQRLEDALPLVEHCAAQARIAGTPANTAQVLYLRARVSLEGDRRAESVDLLKQALDLASDAGYQRLISLASLELSRIYRKQGELWKAVDISEVGLRASREVGDSTEVISQIQNQGILQADQGRFVQADHLYGGAVRALNALLAKFTSAYARAYFVSRMSDLYSDYFSLALLKLKDPPKAFAILEQARGRSISDSLRGRWTDPDGEADGAVRSPFEKELTRVQLQLWYKEEPQKLRKTLSHIFDLGQRLGPSRETGRHSIEAQTFPPVPLAEVQKALYPEEVILEYVLREPASTCLAISRAGVQGVPLAPRHAIEEAVARYREEILQGSRAPASAQALYNLLPAPIPGLDKRPRITIVPDGLLHLLPFEAILAPSGKMLIETHLVDYSPSATVTWLLRKIPARRATRWRFLGVGDARYPSFDESGGVYFASRLHPARLPGTRAEVSSIARVLSDVSETTTLLGADVSESAIKARNLADFDIIHFAVHGTSDTDFPARSALLLGPGSDETEDGALQAWEISRLRLGADLVVLSACDTAVGRLLDQEGVSNLVQSFLLAGARAVVASIWPAGDRSTADLMTRFYSYLAQGMDKGSALRQAKLDFIGKYQDNALPIYWAGMIMLGDGSYPVLGERRGDEQEGSIQ
ncbi:MAG: CHAT domain-containing protein, partial [Acidobacteria bacterium]|nr:CHAT domain-containing protein [Acidobacteriota bacterium]